MSSMMSERSSKTKELRGLSDYQKKGDTPKSVWSNLIQRGQTTDKNWSSWTQSRETEERKDCSKGGVRRLVPGEKIWYEMGDR